jgi:hypothetical protein
MAQIPLSPRATRISPNEERPSAKAISEVPPVEMIFGVFTAMQPARSDAREEKRYKRHDRVILNDADQARYAFRAAAAEVLGKPADLSGDAGNLRKA